MCSLHEDSFFLDSSVGATRWTCPEILCFDAFLEAMFTPLTPFPTVSLSVESLIRDMLCQYFHKFVCFCFYQKVVVMYVDKVENILKGSLDSISSPPPSGKIQIMGRKVYLR